MCASVRTPTCLPLRHRLRRTAPRPPAARSRLRPPPPPPPPPRSTSTCKPRAARSCWPRAPWLLRTRRPRARRAGRAAARSRRGRTARRRTSAPRSCAPPRPAATRSWRARRRTCCARRARGAGRARPAATWRAWRGWWRSWRRLRQSWSAALPAAAAAGAGAAAAAGAGATALRQGGASREEAAGLRRGLPAPLLTWCRWGLRGWAGAHACTRCAPRRSCCCRRARLHAGACPRHHLLCVCDAVHGAPHCRPSPLRPAARLACSWASWGGCTWGATPSLIWPPQPPSSHCGARLGQRQAAGRPAPPRPSAWRPCLPAQQRWVLQASTPCLAVGPHLLWRPPPRAPPAATARLLQPLPLPLWPCTAASAGPWAHKGRGARALPA